MDYSFAELVDLPAVQSLLDTLSRATGLPSAVIDLDERVLVASGWQEICVRFHRQHPETLRRCRESDGFIRTVLQEKGVRAGEFVTYECRNGLIDIAAPICIGERHVANFFQGQFFFQPPDEAIFRRQACQFGFPEEPYLAALRRVQIVDHGRFQEILSFLLEFLHHLVRMGEERLQRLQAEKELQEQQRRLQRQNAEILRLGKLRGLASGDIEDVARQILETTAHVLQVGRASFWLFDDGYQRLRCLDQYEPAANRHSGGAELEIGRFPLYFAAIEREPNIAADDVRSDLRTQELLAAYLEPAGIASMLDTPILVGGRLVGILCCEHNGARRNWTHDEQNFAGSMADFLSLALEGLHRRQAEMALRESEEKYRLLFAAESDAILILDSGTRKIVEANPAASRLYGYSSEEFRQLGVDDLVVQPEQAHARLDLLVSGQMAKVPLSYHRRRDGTAFPVEISAGTFVWKGRQQLASIIRDVTDRQELIRMKEEVLSMVSHEMRTPLTAIIGFAEFLVENRVAAGERTEYLQIICREGARLQELTENLLDLQRLRAGFETADFELLEVPPLLTSVANLFSRSRATHPIAIECPPALPAVAGSEKQIYRALQNLLSNAIKYSPGGGEITLGAQHDGEALVLWVRDRGIGIPAGADERVFDRFYRGSSQQVKKISGSGLGLALVRAVAENHGGQAWVESAPGEGSTFYLSFPRRQSVGATLPPAEGAGAPLAAATLL